MASGVFISPSPKFLSAILKTVIRHYSSIIFTCHPFQPLPTPQLRVVLFRSVLLLMLQNYNKKIVLMSYRLAAFSSQCQWTRIFISLTTPMAMGTDLGFKRPFTVIFTKKKCTYNLANSIARNNLNRMHVFC